MDFEKRLLQFFLLVTLIDMQQYYGLEAADPYSGTHKYCGRNLVNVLTMVCDGVYNHKMPTKEALEQEISSSQILREKRSVVTIFQPSNNHRRFRRGAYDECCKKGCSLDEMVGYCGHP